MAGKYITTLGDSAQLPKLIQNGFLQGHGDPRIAMVGRSNVGKSTLINTLLKQTIARASKTPGKTQAVHFFQWPEARRIVADLPGYGYAKRSKDDRERWSQFIGDYLKADTRLLRVLLLLDSRHDPSAQDAQALQFLCSLEVGVTLVLTKVDQIRTQSEKAKRKKEFARWLSEQPGHRAFQDGSIFWISAKGEGIPQLVGHIESLEG